MDHHAQQSEFDYQRLEKLTRDSFAPHVDEVFTVQLEDGSQCELRLTEATERKSSSGAPRQDPFSLVFCGARELQLPQRIYNMEHSVLGTLPLFLTPIMPDQTSTYFESIFN